VQEHIRVHAQGAFRWRLSGSGVLGALEWRFLMGHAVQAAYVTAQQAGVRSTKRTIISGAVVLACSLLTLGVAQAGAALPPSTGADVSTTIEAQVATSDAPTATVSQSPALVTVSGDQLVPHGKCQYFLAKARATGDQSFMQRYEACENG
jgi:hypothetical protein